MTWDEYFISMAAAVSLKSKCLSRRIGAVAVRDGKYMMATGYNGPPTGYPHCGDKPENLASIGVCPRKAKGYITGEKTEECPASHAERNVLYEAARMGISLADCTMYMNCPIPCRECAKGIVNSGIVEIVTISDLVYAEPGITGKKILDECGVKIRIFAPTIK